MEMPITVIIVLIVALAVGGGMIAFSDQLLGDARENVGQWELPEAGSDGIIRIASVSAQDVHRLAEQCVRDNLGQASSEQCFVVGQTSGSIAVAPIRALSGTIINVNNRDFTVVTSVAGTPNALFITYEPAGTVTVSS